MQDLQVSEVMTRTIITAKPTDSVSIIAKILTDHSFHHIPVVDDDGMIEGIISSTDLDRVRIGATLFRLPNKEEYTETMFQTMLASEIMTRDLVELHSTDSIRKAYELFSLNTFRALPVVDKGMLLGIVTPLDILNHFFK